MNPLNEKANTLARCGSFYYRTLIDESKAEAEFVSHLPGLVRVASLGNKIAAAVQGECYYQDYHKLIKFTDSDIDWNGTKAALQARVSGGKGAITNKLEQLSVSAARILGDTDWDLLPEDLPKGLKAITSIKMQVLNTSPVITPVYLQVFNIISQEGQADAISCIATSVEAVELNAGEVAEWTFSTLAINADIVSETNKILFQFATTSDAAWQSATAIPSSQTVGVGAYVPSVQFWRLAAPEQSLETFNRPAQLTIADHFFAGTDTWEYLAKEGTPQPIAFPGEGQNIILPESQELIWDLHISKDIMVTSIRKQDGTIMYANQDFATQFGKLTFLQNPIALFPNMQFIAQSYTGRMTNLYNYLVRADEVYGPIDRMMYYTRGAQSIKSLYYASAQAAGLAVVSEDCVVVASSPLLDGLAYITTKGRYDAPYPHTPIALGTKLSKDYIIGGKQLYRLIGPYDPMPSNVTGIELGTALPVPGLVAPNKDIVIRRAFKSYVPEYEGDPSAIAAYHAYLESMTPAITTVNVEDGVTNLTPYISTIPSDSSWQLLLYDKNLSAESMAYTFKFDTYTLTVGYTADLKLYVQGNRTGSAAPNITLTPESVDLGDGGLKLDSFTTLSLNKEFDHPVWPEIASNASQQLTVTEKNNFFVESTSSGNRATALLIKLTYDVQLKQLSCQLILLRGFIEVLLIGGVNSVPTAYTPRCFKGAGGVALTTYLPNWEINNIQSVYTETAGEISISSIAGKISDTAYPEIQDPETSKPEYMENGINHFRYTACANRCIVACINESYMTSQMKLRLMTYLRRELPIGSVLTTANLLNEVNEFQSPISGVEFVLEELRTGLDQLVGAGNYEVDSYDGKIIVHTDRLDDTQLAAVTDLIDRIVPSNAIVERYNHHIEVSWRDINKYAECKTMLAVSKVNPEWWNDVTSDGWWLYPLTSATSLYDNANFGYTGFFTKTPATHVNAYTPNLTFARYLFNNNKKIKYIYLYAPKLKTSNYLFRDANVEEIDGDLSSFEGGENLCQMCSACYNLRVFKCTLPRFGIGKNRSVYGAFSGTKLDKPSALRILNSIGTALKPGEVITSDTLIIGIHVDHKNDTEVQTAIDSAIERGFTLVVQWNGTPTSGVSTLDLEEIYAKVTEDEHGDYIDENGTRCYLDWGHYVTDTTGYKLFFSIYEAEQYFKLTKVEVQEV